MMTRDDDLLMRLHDGEATEVQARRAKEQVRTSPEAAAQLEAMGALGEALREHSARVVAQQSFDGFFARVEDGVRQSRALTLRERLAIRLHQWLRPWAVWPAAAAAGVALLVLVALGLHGGSAGANDCTVESIEYSGSAAAVFLIPDDKGSGHTTVIWANGTEEQSDSQPQ